MDTTNRDNTGGKSSGSKRGTDMTNSNGAAPTYSTKLTPTPNVQALKPPFKGSNPVLPPTPAYFTKMKIGS